MLKIINLSLIFLLLPFISAAEKITLAPDAPSSYVVKKGDTLWDISAVFLKQPWLWPKIWRLNPDIENPHLIYPGDELRLVYDETGQPMLVKGKPTLKWSPKVRTQRKELTPIETISLETIAPYLKYDTVLSPEEVNELPYILGNDEGYKSGMDHFKLYVHGDLKVGQSYAFYEKADAILDPETQEVIGYYANMVGTGKAIRTGNIAEKVPATVVSQSAMREIRSGNVVKEVNESQLLPAFFTMQPATETIVGEIIKAASDAREFGKLEVVLINRGSEDGVMQGDILSVERESPGVVETNDGPVYTADASRWNRMATESNSDYQMPSEALGKMMVFQVYNKMSKALILHSEKPLRLEDIVKSPK
ncbi:LysM peptidoglycan-binding domain-containing protein [Thalassotalea fusca]